MHDWMICKQCGAEIEFPDYICPKCGLDQSVGVEPRTSDITYHKSQTVEIELDGDLDDLEK